MYRAPHHHSHIDTVLRQIKRNLRTGIAATHYQRALAPKRHRVFAGTCVNDGTTKIRQTKKRQHVGIAVVARCHYNKARCHPAVAVMHHKAFSFCFSIYLVNANTQWGLKLVLIRVFFQILHDLNT
jgi:hypothetical protein